MKHLFIWFIDYVTDSTFDPFFVKVRKNEMYSSYMSVFIISGTIWLIYDEILSEICWTDILQLLQTTWLNSVMYYQSQGWTIKHQALSQQSNLAAAFRASRVIQEETIELRPSEFNLHPSLKNMAHSEPGHPWGLSANSFYWAFPNSRVVWWLLTI